MKVTLGTLKDKGEELTTFLEPRVGGKPTLEGGDIQIDDETVREGVKPRHVKTYIKRFLYMKGVRKNYRVFVSGKDLTVQEIVLGEEEKKEEKEAKEEKKEEAAKPEETKEEEPEEAAEPEAEAPEATAKAKPSKPKKAASKKPKSKKKKAEDTEE